MKSIDFIFCTDEFLININREFLKHDYYTDVIAFSNSNGLYLNGEIYISIERVKENHKIFKVKLEDELNRVLIHGVMHLMNYDDSSENLKVLMTKKEDYFLSKF